MTLPKDPFMLLSVVNTFLRDKYASLDELCKTENIDKTELTKSLSAAGFEYSEENNKFW
ncbi:MAG: DUF4250 domain-containing protein [Bacteroidaceae bacterium]